jgi:N-glycosylase/DNA lyase
MERIVDHLREHGAEEVKGLKADGRIPGLDHERAKVDSDGIGSADVVLVPLEDGDRAEALAETGKTEIVVDMNPMSRSAQNAAIPIVDNIIRAVPRITEHARDLDGDPEALRVRQVGDRLEWAATFDAAGVLRERLRLGDDLPAIRETAPDDEVVRDAYDAYWGMCLVDNPVFPTLVSFICSAQMRVERIHRMQVALRREFGTAVEMDGRTYHGFPAPETLTDATEAELRELGLGYRAPYVRDTAAMVADGELTREDVAGLPYEDAREALTGFVGVGDKVADCVALFSLGHLEAVPLDTRIRTAIEEEFPECARGDYAATSRAIRERFGGTTAGYTQTYVFHYLRTREGT